MANIKECKVVLLRQSIDSCKKGDIIKIANNSILHIAPEDNPMCPSYHLYFVSDDKIKEGDKVIYLDYGKEGYIIDSPIGEVGSKFPNDDRHYTKDKSKILHNEYYVKYAKIVASTDTSLGLQDIPETFIKHYVESNGSINAVKIESTNRDKDIIVGYVLDKDVNKPIDSAHEYVENIMGAPYGYYTQDKSKELFNDLVNAYRAGQQNNYASEMISRIMKLKPSLIENIQRHDWRNALEIIDLMFPKQEPESPTDKKKINNSNMINNNGTQILDGNIKACKVVMLHNSKTSFLKGDLIKLSDGLAICMGDASNQDCGITQHLYFVSEDEIKDGDLYYKPSDNTIRPYRYTKTPINQYGGRAKVVASTDSSLGLPMIPDYFIKEYVSNNGGITNIDLLTYQQDSINIDSGKVETEHKLKLTDDNEVYVIKYVIDF